MSNGVNVAERYRRDLRAGMSEEDALAQSSDELLKQKRESDISRFGEQRRSAVEVDDSTKRQLRNNAITAVGKAIVVGADAMETPEKPDIAPVQTKAGMDSDNLIAGKPAPRLELADQSAVARPEIGTKAQMQQAGLSGQEMRKFKRYSSRKPSSEFGDLNQSTLEDIIDEPAPYGGSGSLYGR